ncbi:hypothetical protein AVEN_115388-1 [Araneus ventricosus]|uniref:Uncharacterized protein n=1 Tax=Araneus ventricosus TaxID=182803 RepID=A0A4Y1ZYB0_ARAVE|nr:hypothetical protein AVEN_115388-1 [Araneus ventricosus]
MTQENCWSSGNQEPVIIPVTSMKETDLEGKVYLCEQISLWMVTLTCISSQKALLILSYIESTFLIQLFDLTQVQWETFSTQTTQNMVGKNYLREETIVLYVLVNSFSGLQPDSVCFRCSREIYCCTKHPLATLRGLLTASTQQCHSLPTELINSIILSIERRCRSCISIRGDHNPY